MPYYDQMKKYTYIIIVFALSITSCVDKSKLKHRFIGNTFHCNIESAENEFNRELYLEFVNDSILIRTSRDFESVEYIQSDRWNIESSIFGTRLVLISPFDKVKCRFSESANGIVFSYKKDGTQISGTQIKTNIIKTEDLVGVWVNLNDSFPPRPDPNKPSKGYIYPTYTFNSDNSFKIFSFSNRRNGVWKHNKGSNYILLDGGINNEDVIKIIHLDSNCITISYRTKHGEMFEVKLIKNKA